MFFQIEKLILWPKQQNLKPRVVVFEKNKLNLITGASKTGKSAIIPIMDYCLCASKCAIPTGVIREKTDWYGLVVSIGSKKVLIAREEPENRRASTRMFIEEGDEISIPDTVRVNSNIDNVRLYLNRLSGLTNLNFDVEQTGNPAKKKPSFRDLISFNFQPQNIIANPNALLYRTDSLEQKEKLKVMMWYVLGAVTSEVLFLFHQRQIIRMEMRKVNNELNFKLKSLNKWYGDINGFTNKAIELGLLNRDVTELDSKGKISALSEIKEANKIELSSIEIQRAITQTSKIEQEELKISNEIMKIKSRLINMKEIKEALESKSTSVKKIHDRLLISDWLEKNFANERTYLSSIPEFKSKIINPLLASLKKIEQESVPSQITSNAFSRENIRLQEELSASVDILNNLKKERKILISKRNGGYDNASINQFIGMINYAMKNIDTPDEIKKIETQKYELSIKEKSLSSKIKSESISIKKELALDIISNNITAWLPRLDNERPYDKVNFDDKELTLRIVGKNRDDYLWEIGSGANWVSYHIATLLGMHDFFLKQKSSPVPNFIAFDQPSQAYFPRGNLIDGINDIKDEDIESVRKTFEALNKSTIDRNIQLIVLDHIPKELLANLSNSFLVEEWRDGKKLIPLEWEGHDF